MKSWLEKLFSRLVSAAGGRPEVVLPLYHGLQKAAAGRQELLRRQSRRKVTLSAAALHAILLTITALGSVVLALFMVLNPADYHPHPGVVILVGAHWLLVANMVTSLAGPSLLVDDDLLTMGWWPVSRRELLLARLGTILKPALEVTVALGTVPLIVYAVTGRPPVVPALALAVGLLIQTVGVTSGTAAFLALVLRLGGRRRARRLAALTADGSSFMYLWLLLVLGQRLGPWMGAHLDVVYCLPPFWFIAFGDIWTGSLNRAMAAVGVVLSLAMVTLGLRLMVPAGQGQQSEPLEEQPSRWHWSSLVSSLLRPMMPGREGWVVRRLLESHLREDWRFVGGMLTVPVMLAFLFFGLDQVVPDDLNPAKIRVTALTAIHHSQFLTLMAASVVFLASYSSTPRALWIVGLADLDAGRLLGAQRGMIRGVVVAPVLALYALKASLMGAAPRVVALDMLMLGLQVEIMLTIMQSLLMIMPFSLAYTNDQSARRVVMGFVAAGVALVLVVLNFLYAAFAPARLAVWVGLPLVMLLLRKWSRRRLAGRRLRMDSVVGV